MTGIAADSPPIDGVLVKETGEGRFQVKIQTAGEAFLADEPVSVGGDGTGPNPYELLAAGLGACTAMTLRLYAERKGWPLKCVEVRVLHRRDKLVNRDRFAREIALAGDLDEAQRRRLLEIANRCPVHLTLERGADLVTTLVHLEHMQRRDSSSDRHMQLMAEACED
ncbi:MAG: OsmC family protein [Hyphomonadaceae bacterium]|nr:OsmC family protein [Hyphomonadaceae bacterium]